MPWWWKCIFAHVALSWSSRSLECPGHCCLESSCVTVDSQNWNHGCEFVKELALADSLGNATGVTSFDPDYYDHPCIDLAKQIWLMLTV